VVDWLEAQIAPAVPRLHEPKAVADKVHA
jgi:hypothetical protein